MVSKYPPDSTSPRLVGKQNTAGQDVLAASFTAGAATYGSWAQVTASAATELYVVGFVVTGSGGAGTGAFEHLVQVGIGGSGSETALGTCPASAVWVLTGTSTHSVVGTFSVPLRIASGQRIAIRGQVAGTGGATVSLSGHLIVVPYTSVEGN